MFYHRTAETTLVSATYADGSWFVVATRTDGRRFFLDVPLSDVDAVRIASRLAVDACLLEAQSLAEFSDWLEVAPVFGSAAYRLACETADENCEILT